MGVPACGRWAPRNFSPIAVRRNPPESTGLPTRMNPIDECIVRMARERRDFAPDGKALDECACRIDGRDRSIDTCRCKTLCQRNEAEACNLHSPDCRMHDSDVKCGIFRIA